MNFFIHPILKKKLRKMPRFINVRFDERLKLFIVDPIHFSLNNHSVGKTYIGCRSINITGDYRAIFYMKDDVAVFINIGTHSELY